MKTLNTLLVSALFSAAALALPSISSAAVYNCTPQTQLVRTADGGYQVQNLTSTPATQGLFLQVTGTKVVAGFQDQPGQPVSTQVGANGNRSQCHLPAMEKALYTFSYPSYSLNVVSVPAAAFQGAKQIQVTEVIDDDGDGYDCLGLVWNCSLAQ